MFKTDCLQKYALKSQKENIFIIFLYLHKLLLEKKIDKETIEAIRDTLHSKIDGYIANSHDKI